MRIWPAVRPTLPSPIQLFVVQLDLVGADQARSHPQPHSYPHPLPCMHGYVSAYLSLLSVELVSSVELVNGRRSPGTDLALAIKGDPQPQNRAPALLFSP